jgi:hypothetical protein
MFLLNSELNLDGIFGEIEAAQSKGDFTRKSRLSIGFFNFIRTARHSTVISRNYIEKKL